MKNSKFTIVFLFIILIAIIIGVIFIFNSSNNSNKNKDVQNTFVSTNNVESYNTDNTNIINQQAKEKVEDAKNNIPKETLVSAFSTDILDDSEGRLTNIKITCDILNNTTVEPGQVFSFNEIVGQPSSSRGYEEASIIINGEHETGIGGGNCQVSSTLYNAVLEAENLAIVERNEHGGSGVAYVPEGRDAAVSYGSLDFKFRNDNDYKIKITMETDDENITASMFKIED